MRLLIGLTLFRLILPLLFIAAFPGWIVKMIRRGGLHTRLGERAAFYRTPRSTEPNGAVHIHAISVGETMLALKLIREWRKQSANQPFVLAVGTATGHAVATSAKLPNLRVTYSPLDFPWMVRRYLKRFHPSQIVLIEGEIWPNLLLASERRHIPVRLVNARMSPRSARRYRKAAAWIRPFFSKLHAVCIQEPADRSIWEDLGIAPDKIHLTGSLKFDPASGHRPIQRPEFAAMLERFGSSRKIILAASTHDGEEPWIAAAIRDVGPEALPVIVPRHAERRAEVSTTLSQQGFEVILRSSFRDPVDPARACLVIDSTGELADWTAHADVVIIGKSFLATGGQNPCEAILARKPLITGPHMENFEPLSSRLSEVEARLVAHNPAELTTAIRRALDPATATFLTRNAATVLAPHEGATYRIVVLLSRTP
ncbi:MAG: glycosyltransferase N-terminal domain-containing protein [Luteolibacter sp.]